MDQTPPTEGGLFSSVTRMIHTLRALAGTRLELFLTELKEERLRLFDALLLFGVAMVCSLMALATLTFTIVLVFWETHRLLALVLLTVLYVVLATVALVKLGSRLQRWESFSATMNEFKKDAACFKKPN